MEAESEEDVRNRIAMYFDHLARRPIGYISLEGASEQQMYSWVASWIRNGVDATWYEETKANGAIK